VIIRQSSFVNRQFLILLTVSSIARVTSRARSAESSSAGGGSRLAVTCVTGREGSTVSADAARTVSFNLDISSAPRVR
jgi:hypothetical protein